MKRRIRLNKNELYGLVNECVKGVLLREYDVHRRNGQLTTHFLPQSSGGKYINYDNGTEEDSGINIDNRTYMGKDKGKVKIKPSALFKYQLFNYLYNNYEKTYPYEKVIGIVLNNLLQRLNTNTGEKATLQDLPQFKQKLITLCQSALNTILSDSNIQVDPTDRRKFFNNQDNIIQLSMILSKKLKNKDAILYYINDEMKLGSLYDNYENMYNEYERNNVSEKDRLNYYKLKLPGTNVDVISLYSFDSFAGTELIKANAISVANKDMKGRYGEGPNNRVSSTFSGTQTDSPMDAFNFEFDKTEDGGFNSDVNSISQGIESGSAQHFIEYSMKHGKQVLAANNFTPNFMICVPSTSSFNENYIKKFSSYIGGCKSYYAFMKKNWLSYQLTDSDMNKIREYIEYIKYQYGDSGWENSEKGIQDLIERGICNSFLYTISKQIKNVFNEELNQLSASDLNTLQSYSFFMLLKQHNNIGALVQGSIPTEETLQTKIKNNYNITKKNPNLLAHNLIQYIYSKITNSTLNNKNTSYNAYDKKFNTVVANCYKELEQYIPGKGKKARALPITIKQNGFKDSDVQMTSLVPSGNTGGTNQQLNGREIRPLMVSVYLVDRETYELTADGQRLIDDLKNFNMPLNESTKVEMARQKILVFDDDMDTGASLKLCVSTLLNIINQNKIQGTDIKCMTVFNHLQFNQRTS